MMPPHLARLYDTSAWRQRRRRQLMIEPLCRICLEDGHKTPATGVEHVEPVVDEHMFFDGELRSVCLKHCR